MATARLSVSLNQPLGPCVLRGAVARPKVAKVFFKRPMQKPLRRQHKTVAQIGWDVNEIIGPYGELFEQGFFVSLGLAAAGFVGAFFVAPNFKEDLKEDFSWKEMVLALREADLKSIPAEEAQKNMRQGAVIVDVRSPSDYDQGFIEGSLNVPLYRAIQGWGLAANVRRAAFAFFGIYGSELNPNWLAEMEEKVPKNKKVVVACSRGGTINARGTKFGFESRSLKAAFRLQNAGYRSVQHLKGGISQWERDGLPILEYYDDGEDDE